MLSRSPVLRGRAAQYVRHHLDAHGVGAYLASQEKLDLVLHAFRLPKQALFNVQPLKPAFSGADIVHLGRAILLGATEQVLCVVAYVPALGLYCSRVSCASFPDDPPSTRSQELVSAACRRLACRGTWIPRSSTYPQ
jgi:hypothetical protein